MSGWRPSPRRKPREFASASRSQLIAPNAGNRRPSPSTRRKVTRFIAAPAFSPDARQRAHRPDTMDYGWPRVEPPRTRPSLSLNDHPSAFQVVRHARDHDAFFEEQRAFE